MTKIYILERNNIPFYVGKTLQEIKDRYYTHGDRKVNSKIIEIDCVDDNEWRFWESWYIELFKSWGFELENKNKGGGGRGPGWISPPERNAKIKASLQNHSQYYTDEVKEKISKGNKGKLKPFTKEHQQNILFAKRKQAKPLLMFDLNDNLIKEWESKGQAAEWIKETKKRQGNLSSQIKDAILGRQKTAFGYKWKYKQ
jgi:predicted GIY-YIG superfamily endonuclease